MPSSATSLWLDSRVRGLMVYYDLHVEKVKVKDYEYAKLICL